MEEILVFGVVSGVEKSKYPTGITLGSGNQVSDGRWRWIRRNFMERCLSVGEEIGVRADMVSGT